MASINSDHNNTSRQSEHDGSINSRDQSPKRVLIQPLNLKKPRSEQPSKTGKASTTDRDIKPKRLILEDDMVHSSGYEELADQVLNSIPLAASSSSQSSASRRPSSPSRRRSSRQVPSHQYSVTAPPSPHHIDDITPIDTPSRTANTAQNYNRKSSSYSRAHSVDYTSHSGAMPPQQNGRKSHHHESPQSLPSRRPSYAHQRHSSTATASSGRRLSQYTFESPHAGTPPYSYSPEEYHVDESPILAEDGGLQLPGSMGMPNLQMASNAVMKANLRSGDPYQELSRFLDNVNGMLSSLTLSIPHLQLLCDRYRSIQEKLLEYNALVEVNRSQEEVIGQKEKQVFSLKEKLNQMATIHSAEGNRLRNKIGSLEAEIRIFNDIVAAKNSEIEELASKFDEEKELLRSEGEKWGAAKGEAFREEKLDLLEKHDAEIEILEEGHHANIREIEEAHAMEKSKIMESYESKIKGLEERHQLELNGILETKASEVNEIHRQVASQLENNHATKLAALKDAHGVEMRALESKFYAKLETLKVDVGKRRAELEKAHAAEKNQREEEFEKERALWIAEKEQLEGQIKYFQYEKNTTAFTHEAEKNSLLGMVQSSEQTTRQLEKENQRINAVLKKMGDADMGLEIKGRGDGFYIDAFTTLTKDIIDISSKFLDLPRMPPGDVIAEIPSNLPNILADTDASRILRQAYIQHVISTILCKRIFSPFLFSLGNRYDNADSLLKAMSAHLRKKSTRREAVWRNYTLMAAYTANSAKAHAASAATAVIEEIVTKIRPFAEAENLDRISAGVRRVVKYAIDTWRYARLEKEMFVARVETEADDAVWGHHSYEKQFPYVTDLKLIEEIRGRSTGRRKVVLHLLPLIYREGMVPSITQSDTVLDDGHVFTHGIALFSDCLPVLHRKIELQTPASSSSSPGEETRYRRKELEKSDRAVDETITSRHLEDARMRAQQMELEKKEEARIRAEKEEARIRAEKEEARIRAEKERLEMEREKARKEAELQELKQREEIRLKAEQEELEKKEEAARLKAEEEKLKQLEQLEQARITAKLIELEGRKKQEEIRIKAEREEAEKRELARVQAEKEEQRRALEEARIIAERQEEEAREAALMEAVELEDLARIEDEIETAARAEAQLLAEEKAQKERELLLKEAEEIERMELEAQRVEDEGRDKVLQEMAEFEQWQTEQEMLARVELEIRDAEEAEAQLVADEKAKRERERLEAEAKARAEEEELERERLRQREERRKEVRAKIEAEVAAKKLERERERERLRLKAEAEEKEREAERQRILALVQAEAEAERLRLESETERDLLQDKTLTAAVGGGARSNLGATEEVDARSDVMSDAEMSTLGRGIAEAASILSMGTENFFRGVGNSNVERAMPEEVDERAEMGIMGVVAEEAMTQKKENTEECDTREPVVETTDRGFPADEGASMIWLRLSEPESRSEINHLEEFEEEEEEEVTGPIHAVEGEIEYLPMLEHATEERSISRIQDHEPAAAATVVGFDGEIDRDSIYDGCEPHTREAPMEKVQPVKAGEFVQRNRDLEVDEDINSVYSDGGRTYLSQPGEEEVDLDDESFDSCGASVGGQDDEESDYERGVGEYEKEEDVARGTVIGDEEDGLTELPQPLPPMTLEGHTPGRVELASFDFGLGAESDGEEYGEDPHWEAEDWETQHGAAEASGEEDGNKDSGHKRGFAFVTHDRHAKQRDGHEEEPEETHEGNYEDVHVVGHEEEVHQGEPHIESQGLSRQHHDRFDADSQIGGEKEDVHQQEHEVEQQHIHDEEEERDVRRYRGVERSQEVEDDKQLEGHDHGGGHENIEGQRAIEGQGKDRHIEFRDRSQQEQHSTAGSQIADEEQQNVDEELDGSDYGGQYGGRTEINYGSDQDEEQDNEEYDEDIVADEELSEADYRGRPIAGPEGMGEQEEGQGYGSRSSNKSQLEQEEVNSRLGEEGIHDRPDDGQYESDHGSQYGAQTEMNFESDLEEHDYEQERDDHSREHATAHEEGHDDVHSIDSRRRSRLDQDHRDISCNIDHNDLHDIANEADHGSKHGSQYGSQTEINYESAQHEEHEEAHEEEHEGKRVSEHAGVKEHEDTQRHESRSSSPHQHEQEEVNSQSGDEVEHDAAHESQYEGDHRSQFGAQTEVNYESVQDDEGELDGYAHGGLSRSEVKHEEELEASEEQETEHQGDHVAEHEHSEGNTHEVDVSSRNESRLEQGHDDAPEGEELQDAAREAQCETDRESQYDPEAKRNYKSEQDGNDDRQARDVHAHDHAAEDEEEDREHPEGGHEEEHASPDEEAENGHDHGHLDSRSQSRLEEVSSQYGDEEQRSEVPEQDQGSDNGSNYGRQTEINFGSDWDEEDHNGSDEEHDQVEKGELHGRGDEEPFEDHQSEAHGDLDQTQHVRIAEEGFERVQEEHTREEYDEEVNESSYEIHDRECEEEQHSDTHSQYGDNIHHGETVHDYYESDHGSRHDVHPEGNQVELGEEDHETHIDSLSNSERKLKEWHSELHSETHSQADYEGQLDEIHDEHDGSDNASRRDAQSATHADSDHEEEVEQELGERVDDLHDPQHEGQDYHLQHREGEESRDKEKEETVEEHHEEHGDEHQHGEEHREVSDEEHHSDAESRYESDHASQIDAQSVRDAGSHHERYHEADNEYDVQNEHEEYHQEADKNENEEHDRHHEERAGVQDDQKEHGDNHERRQLERHEERHEMEVEEREEHDYHDYHREHVVQESHHEEEHMEEHETRTENQVHQQGEEAETQEAQKERGPNHQEEHKHEEPLEEQVQHREEGHNEVEEHQEHSHGVSDEHKKQDECHHREEQVIVQPSDNNEGNQIEPTCETHDNLHEEEGSRSEEPHNNTTSETSPNGRTEGNKDSHSDSDAHNETHSGDTAIEQTHQEGPQADEGRQDDGGDQQHGSAGKHNDNDHSHEQSQSQEVTVEHREHKPTEYHHDQGDEDSTKRDDDNQEHHAAQEQHQEHQEHQEHHGDKDHQQQGSL